MEDKKSFVDRLFFDILDIYITGTKLTSRFTNIRNPSIIFCGETALYFANKQYNPDQKINSLDEKYIEMVVSEPYDKILKKILDSYGTIKECKEEICTNISVKKIIKVSLEIGKFEVGTRYNNISSLMYKILKEKFNGVILNFKIYITENEENYNCKEKVFAKDCLIAEYHQELEMFIFSSNADKRYNSLTSIELVAAQPRMKNSDYDFLNYDLDVALDPEKIVKMVSEGKDMKLYKQLEYNENVLDKEYTCSICQEDTKKGFKTICGHVFHCECLEDFLKIYYSELEDSINKNQYHGLLHDLQGNIIKGASYTWCCPNCKYPCFKLDVKYGEITNKECCIYKLEEENIKTLCINIDDILQIED